MTDDGAPECGRCGVIFAKIAQRATVAAGTERPGDRDGVPYLELVRAAAVLGLAVWTWRFARAPIGALEMQSVLHLPNLVFHEAGHVIFSLFGRFITVLGGSLFQVAVPLVCAGAFLRKSDQFAAAVCTWWAGQNLVDLAPYIADARALQLVLLGGKTGAEVEGHDWEYLLDALGWMQYDRALGLASRRLGLLVMAASLVWAGVAIVRQRKVAAAEWEM